MTAQTRQRDATFQNIQQELRQLTRAAQLLKDSPHAPVSIRAKAGYTYQTVLCLLEAISDSGYVPDDIETNLARLAERFDV